MSNWQQRAVAPLRTVQDTLFWNCIRVSRLLVAGKGRKVCLVLQQTPRGEKRHLGRHIGHGEQNHVRFAVGTRWGSIHIWTYDCNGHLNVLKAVKIGTMISRNVYNDNVVWIFGIYDGCMYVETSLQMCYPGYGPHPCCLCPAAAEFVAVSQLVGFPNLGSVWFFESY
jgi:hypothetical protein